MDTILRELIFVQKAGPLSPSEFVKFGQQFIEYLSLEIDSRAVPSHLSGNLFDHPFLDLMCVLPFVCFDHR
jgi:hypothetical protein